MKMFLNGFLVCAAALSCSGSAQWDLILAPVEIDESIEKFDGALDENCEKIRLSEKHILGIIAEKFTKKLKLDGILKLKTQQNLNLLAKSKNWKVKLLDQVSEIKPNMAISFNVIDCGNVIFSAAKMRITASLTRDVYVSKKPIASNSDLKNSDFYIEQRDVLSLKSAPFDTKIGLLLHDAKKSIKAGEVLLTEFVGKKPDIMKGQTIDVVGDKGGLSISLKCIAMENGRMNQSISVRNEQTNKTFYAKIISEGVARVSL